MASKNTILTLLGNEIDKFSANYEERINDLNKQILQLKKEFYELKSENKVLKAKLLTQNDPSDYKNKYENLLHYMNQLSNGVTYEVIDQWCLSSVVEDAFMLLSSLNHMLLDGQDLNKAIYIINLIEHNQRTLEHNDPQIHQLIQKVLTNIFISKHLVDNDNKADELYLCSLNLLRQISKSKIEDVIKEFISKNFYKIMDTIFYLNVPEIINAFMKVCHFYDLKVEVKDTFYHLFEEEWTFLESSFTKEDFIFLLWYAFLYDLDEKLIENSSDCLQWFEESTKDLSLYFYLYDSINRNINPNMKDYKVQVQKFNDGTVLKVLEKEEVLTKVESKIKPLIEKYKALKLFDNKLIIIKDEQEQYFIKKYNLSINTVLIPLFQGKNDNLVYGYAEVSILQKDNSKKEAYILEKDWEQMKKEHFPLIAKAKKLNGLLIDEKKVQEIKNSGTNNFKWPETELAEKTATVVDQNDDKSLNENSALKLMGYQITGLTKAKRWLILQKAVPTLGLRKVANIIAYNVKLRKGQKNGINKYQNAITEWEYDLAQLKKEYYKKDFNWPTV